MLKKIIASAESFKLLIVEDDPGVYSVFSKSLVGFKKRDGTNTFEIRGAKTLAEARRAIRAQRFDLILADLGLPDGRGFELLDRRNGLPRFPVIVVTGEEQEELSDEAIQSGALGFYSKNRLSARSLPEICLNGIRSWNFVRELRKVNKTLARKSVELKNALEELSANELLFYKVTEQFPHTIFLLELDGHINYLNPAGQNLSGYLPHEIEGTKFHMLKLFKEEEHSILIERFSKALEGKDVGANIYTAVSKTGEEIKVEIRTRNITIAKGKKYVIGSAIDVTEKEAMKVQIEKMMEEAKSAEEEARSAAKKAKSAERKAIAQKMESALLVQRLYSKLFECLPSDKISEEFPD